MLLWLDENLPPALAPYIADTFGVECRAFRDVGLKDARDEQAFALARQAGAVLLTKDLDFVQLHARLGPPPSIIRLKCGNITNHDLRELLSVHLSSALAIIGRGVTLLELPLARELL